MSRGPMGNGRSPKRILQGSRGAIFVTVVVAVAVLLVVVVALSSLASGESRATPYWRDRGAAVYVAESGLNHTLWKAKYDRISLEDNEAVYDPTTYVTPSFTSDNAPESLGLLPPGSYYEVWYKTVEGTTNQADVTVRATVGDQSHIISCRIAQQQIPFPTKSDEKGGIDGENEYGVPSNAIELPPIHISAQDWPPPEGVDSVDGQYHFGSPLPPGTYVTDYVQCDGQGALLIDGDVTIWVRQFITSNGTGTVNPTGAESIAPEDRTHLIFYMPPEDNLNVTLTGDTEFNAMVYAPTASIKVTGSQSVFGSLVGETIKTNKYVFYDDGALEIGYSSAFEVDYVVTFYSDN